LPQKIYSEEHLALEHARIINQKMYNEGSITHKIYGHVNQSLLKDIAEEISKATAKDQETNGGA
jgi:hypothetical protein